MSETNFRGPILGQNILAGVSVSQGGILNANFGTGHSEESSEQRELDTFLELLFTTDPHDDLSRTNRQSGGRIEGTCNWILKRPEYVEWLHGHHLQILWLIGAPGSGKTVDACFLIEELQKLVSTNSNMMLVYHLCDFKDEYRRSATNILRSILFQILKSRPDSFSIIQQDYARRKGDAVNNLDILWRTILQIIEFTNLRAYFVIDALDECDKSSQSQLLDLMTELDLSSNLRILITGRPEPEFLEYEHAAERLYIEPTRIHDDISKYIDSMVDNIGKRKKYPLKFANDIKNNLKNQAGDTFLWPSLILKDIAAAKTINRAKEKLQKIPSSLFDVYQRILDSIVEEDQIDAALVLQWIVTSRRPMTVTELSTAFALSSGEASDGMVPSEEILTGFADIFKSCGPILYHDSQNDTISLIHQTAKEFLSRLDHTSPYHVNPQNSGMQSLKVCWNYLALEGFDQGDVIMSRNQENRLRPTQLSKRILQSYEFLRYATDELLYGDTEERFKVISMFISQTSDLDQLPVIRDYWLLWAAAVGNVKVVTDLLSQGASREISIDGDAGMTPLQLAAYNGHLEVCETLLYTDDELEIGEAQIALDLAADGGHRTLVEMLLERIREKHDGVYNIKTPFMIAVANKFEDVAILLLDSESEIHWKATALGWAAVHGCCRVIKRLVDLGADVHAYDGLRFTPLARAVDGDHTETARFLIDAGADIKWRELGTGRTLLHLAIHRNRLDMVTLLVEKRARLEDTPEGDFSTSIGISESRFKYSALDLASMLGNKAIVERLIQAGAPLLVSTNSGTTSLHLAVLKNHVSIVRILLNKGVDPSITDNDGQTALHIAAGLGHDTIINLLLSRAPGVEKQDKYGWTPLHHAAYGERISTILLLVTKHGANVNSRDFNEQTPIHVVADNAIEDGRDSLDWPSRTRLGNERLQRMGDVVRYLLSHGADIHATDSKSQTALHMVSSGYLRTPKDEGDWLASGVDASVAISQVLLEHGVNVAAKDVEGQTALINAINIKHCKLVRLLVQRGADASFMEYIEKIKFPKPDVVQEALESFKTAGSDGHSNREDPMRGSEMIHCLVEVLDYARVMKEPSLENLFNAIKNHQTSIASLLLQNLTASMSGEDIKMTYTLAARSGHADTLRLILETKLHARCEEYLAEGLVAAVSEGHEPIVRLITEYYEGSGGISPQTLKVSVITAVRENRDEILRLLLEKGAKITERTENEESLIQVAAIHRRACTFRILINLGSQIWSLDDYKSTFIYAVREGMVDIVQNMIEYGVQVRGFDNENPLFAAIPTKDEAMVELLLSRGCDTRGKNKDGKTPLDVAFELSNPMPILKLLVQYGADLGAAIIEMRPLDALLRRFSPSDIITFLEWEPDYFDLTHDEGQELMTWAIESEYGDVVDTLVHKGVETNVRPSEMAMGHIIGQPVNRTLKEPCLTYQKRDYTSRFPSRDISMGPGVKVRIALVGNIIGCQIVHLNSFGKRLQYIEW